MSSVGQIVTIILKPDGFIRKGMPVDRMFFLISVKVTSDRHSELVGYQNG